MKCDATGIHVEAKGSAQGFDINLSAYAGMSHRTGLPNIHPNVACCLESNGQYLWLAQNSDEKHVMCYEVKESGSTLVYQSKCHVDEQSTLSILADKGYCWITDGKRVEKYARLTITTVKDPLIADVIISLCEQAGLAKEQIDVSALEKVQAKPEYKLPGYTVNQSSHVRNSLQTLLTAYQLIAIESNGKLKFMPKREHSQQPVTVIPYAKLLVAANSKASSFSLHRQQSTDLPQRLSISYAECDSDYQVSTESATQANNRSQHLINKHEQVIEIPLVLEKRQAQQIVNRLLLDAWQSRETYQFALGLEYLFLEPGDVVQLVTNALTYTLAITQLEIGYGQLHVNGLNCQPCVTQSSKSFAPNKSASKCNE